MLENKQTDRRDTDITEGFIAAAWSVVLRSTTLTCHKVTKVHLLHHVHNKPNSIAIRDHHTYIMHKHCGLLVLLHCRLDIKWQCEQMTSQQRL